MAKSTTEAAPKRASKRISKGKPLAKEDVQFERPLMDDPEDDDNDPGPLPEEEKIPAPPKKDKWPKIEIVKGKLLKEKVEIEFMQQNNIDSKPAKGTWDDTAAPRKQMRNAFGALAVHAALIGEYIPLTAIDEILEPDPDKIKDFNVSGFSLVAHGDEDEGVILTAQKTLKSGKTLGFNTPIIRFADESENSYPHLDELSEAIDRCKGEMKLYLNGTHEPDPQGKLFD